MSTELACHCVQTTPLHVYSDTSSNGLHYCGLYIALAGCSLSYCGLFFPYCLVFQRCLQNLSVYLSPFPMTMSQNPTVMVIMELVNVIYRKCDFSLFPITKEMQNKWLVAALLCKITINWVCSEKCTISMVNQET